MLTRQRQDVDGSRRDESVWNRFSDRRRLGKWRCAVLALVGPCVSSAEAVAPPHGIPAIAIGGCDMAATFADDFKDFHVESSVYKAGGWTAHTPWAGDFGDAIFVDPAPGFPFAHKDGVLTIEARKGSDQKWRSGLLASADPTGKGFGQTYGYFEMSSKLPKGLGTWPAFWLMTKVPKGSGETTVEIDALEHYGKFSADFHSGIHVWNAQHDGTTGEHVTSVPRDSLYTTFHTYGVDVEPDFISFYFDRKPTWRLPTPPEHKKPLSILLNLALGSGWPIDKTPNPSIMEVAYVRVYARIDPACASGRMNVPGAAAR